jgi:hypothetical protein
LEVATAGYASFFMEDAPVFRAWWLGTEPYFTRSEAERIGRFNEELIRHGGAEEHVRFDPGRGAFLVSYSDRPGGGRVVRAEAVRTTEGQKSLFPIGLAQSWQWARVDRRGRLLREPGGD